MPNLVDQILDEIRAEIAPSDRVLGAARERRGRVLAIANVMDTSKERMA